MPTENRSSNTENAPGPFCRGHVDPEGWLRGDGARGPECESCGATAPNLALWNAAKEAEQCQGEPVARKTIHIEVRECEGCNHIGIDDSHSTLSACHECEWSGLEPLEDKCPGCERENCMAAACPDCGSRYVLATSKTIEVVADPAEVERLRSRMLACEEIAENNAKACAEALTKLAEGQALLLRITDTDHQDSMRAIGEAAVLSASAEPSAPTADRLAEATAFVRGLVDCAGEQGSVATGYLRDILDVLTGKTEPSAPDDCAICRDLGNQCMECEEGEFCEWADRHFAAADYRKTDAGVFIQDWMRHAYGAWCARGALTRKQ